MDPCKNSQRRLNDGAKLTALSRDKTIQDGEPIFCSKYSMLKFFKT